MVSPIPARASVRLAKIGTPRRNPNRGASVPGRGYLGKGMAEKPHRIHEAAKRLAMQEASTTSGWRERRRRCHYLSVGAGSSGRTWSWRRRMLTWQRQGKEGAGRHALPPRHLPSGPLSIIADPRQKPLTPVLGNTPAKVRHSFHPEKT